jgi:Domain of unknown function (DUF3854)
VVIVEGAKKAACLLTIGYAAIAIPGVNSGYRTPKDEFGNIIGKPNLVPDLKHFATEDRRIDICFDRDKKPETVQHARTAIKRMGKLLAIEKCKVRVIEIPGPEKGVDDFVVAQGEDAFNVLYHKAETLDIWQVKLFTLLTYQPAIECDRKFIGQIQIPDTEKLIVLKSAKGTGKTEWLTGEVAKAHEQNRRARLRETVNRHIWVRGCGMGFVGNGSTSMGSLLASQHAATRTNIALLSQADNADYTIDENFQPESLQSWAKRACVINAQMRCYREFVLQGLAEDGYRVVDAENIGKEEGDRVFESVKAASQELHGEECKAIASQYCSVNECRDVTCNVSTRVSGFANCLTEQYWIASCETISDTEFKKLQDKKAKTKTERHQERKASLNERYGVDVTPELVWKDDNSWYPQLRLHYFLTLGREHLVERDAKRAKSQIEVGESAVWKPDFNRGQLLPAVLILEELNIHNAEIKLRSRC